MNKSVWGLQRSKQRKKLIYFYGQFMVTLSLKEIVDGMICTHKKIV